MSARDVIIRPVVTEKTMKLQETDNKITFEVAKGTNKTQVKQAIEEIERNTGKTYEKLYIVGGGAKNQYLNRLTEEATGKQVIALPIEATALGNLNIQMEVENA